MSRRTLRAVPEADPADARHPTLSPEQFIQEVYKRLNSPDDDRVIPYYRLRELTPPGGPFSESWVKARIADGTLEAVKLGKGLRLITKESVDRMLASAEVWEPKG